MSMDVKMMLNYQKRSSGMEQLHLVGILLINL